MKKSQTTRDYLHKRNFCKIMSFLLTFLPLIIYGVIAFVQGTVENKVSFGLCLTICALFVIMNILMKLKIRCTLWVLLLGIHICLKNIVSLIIIMAISTALDEFVFEPLVRKYSQKASINIEIDKREQQNI